MASYQLDWEGRVNNEKDIFALIEKHKSSQPRRFMIQAKSYYEGENWTIMHLPDRTYWSDRILTDENGQDLVDENGRPIRANCSITNPFVSNNRVAYGVFHDIVSQKVNTLFNETPTFAPSEKLKEKYTEGLGYAFKKAGTEASICGYSFVYESSEGNFTVFDTANCIAFYDDASGVLKVLVRYIEAVGEFSKKRQTIAEVYKEDGLTIWKKTGAKIELIQDLTPYKFERQQSIILDEVKSIALSKLPIIVFKNNDEMKSDLTPSIRAKIDVIDLVQSGFINNIEDFSDVFWVFKKTDGSDMNADDYEDFMANINKTKKLFVDDASPEQFNIPHEARTRAMEILESQLIKESGVIDTEKLTATQLTTTAIKAATMKLEQRVNDFEWFANEGVRTAIKLWQEYNGESFEFDVDFSKMIINNATEVIDNLVKIRQDISRHTVLVTLQKLGYIASVEEEEKRLEEESVDNVPLLLGDDEEDGQGSQTNGQAD